MRSRAPLALAFVSSLLSTPALATVMLPLSIEDMSKEALAVVRARVLDQHADWDAKHQRIYTHTRVAVLDTIHARASMGPELVIRTLGGEVGETGMKVAGTPSFALDEEVVVFLRVDPEIASELQVIGMAQGKLHVRRTAKGQAMVVPSLEGLAFVRPDSTGVLKASEAKPSETETPLESFVERVKRSVASLDAAVSPPIAPPVPSVPAKPAVTR
ncbi:MAG: hypothetical protein HYV07_04800 [Deltaproteobacteria bacterium]|nr:hypothetical protein [Deltaproteobacteria bacterium]